MQQPYRLELNTVRVRGVRFGDPLGLPVYHILEPEIKAQINSELYQEHVGLLELTVDVDEIINEVRRFREA